MISLVKDRIIEFCKKETVFVVAWIAALISMIFVMPSIQYVDYIDFKVLSLLFSLMLVVSGLRGVGIFDRLCIVLLYVVKNTRSLAFVLVLICFFTSMWITNDVALITFVPFAIMILEKLHKREMMIPVLVFQTIAANLGSMCTPIGNPQNLYLYSISGMDIVTFMKLLLPTTVTSLILIIICLIFFKKEPLENIEINKEKKEENLQLQKNRIKTLSYLVLFLICILTVLHVVNYMLSFAIVVVAVLVLDRKLFKEADYILLLTFVAFFIFVGNMKNITVFSNFLSKCVNGNEVLSSVIASQVISNVPAAVLLSGFTTNYQGLILGTNIGGLGTLIASMASLISYKFYCGVNGASKKSYFVNFTLTNVIFLVILLLEVIII